MSLARASSKTGSPAAIVVLAPFGVDVDKGSTPTALLVSVTDPNATRYFSQVFGDGDQALTRSAEAEYNLPIPLGSPLNYFGGDASRTVQPIVSTHTINWPRDYATREPVNTDCDVGATSAQGFGGWSGSPATYNAAAFSGRTRCEWTVLSENPGKESTTPPPDHTTRAPSNNGGSGCRVQAPGPPATTIGQWQATFSSSTTGTAGLPDCSWPTVTTVAESIPAFYDGSTSRRAPCPDFNARVPTPGQPGAGDANPNSCWWKLAPTAANVTTFGGSWQTLCTLNANNDEIYLVNVNTSSSNGNGAGVNSYALEATSSACALDGACQPSVYAFGDMGMYNNIDAGLSTFYLAEVGPQFAGKTLVIELWDSGDANGVARMTPQRPSAAMPKPVVPVPASECSYGADTPNPRHGSSQFGGATSAAVAAGTSPPGPNCTILTANQPSASGTPRVSLYNDEWLTIKVDIPADYTCALGENPEITAGSCWWGIEYDFSKRATDVTTWRARIEGNPVHLTT